VIALQSPEMPGGSIGRLVRRVVSIQPGEGRLVAWAWLYLFAVFSAYYVIRPIRDDTLPSVE
jgi:AAA family ATP:ADP antiporter